MIVFIPAIFISCSISKVCDYRGAKGDFREKRNNSFIVTKALSMILFCLINIDRDSRYITGLHSDAWVAFSRETYWKMNLLLSRLNGVSFVDGVWKKHSNNLFHVFNPATLDKIGSVPDMTVEDTQIATTAAYKVLQGWKTTTARHRANVLKKWHSLILDNKEQLAQLITLECGKPINESLGEFSYGAKFMEWFSEEPSRINGDWISPTSADRRIIVMKQPVGVAALICPWNFPLAMIARKVAPALAAGCSVVIKPASETPFTCLAFASLGAQAGVPEGVVNVITASRTNTPAVGKSLCEDRRIRKISFTGSTQVGKLLASQSVSTMKRVSLELGGNAPFIVFEDADVDKAVDGVMASKFRNAGQTCVCTNRIYVHRSIQAVFTTKLRSKIQSLKVGLPNDPKTQIGPLISKEAVLKVQRHISDAVSLGAKVELGGNRLQRVGDFFFEPTLLSGMTKEMAVASEETFGPIAAVFSFDTEQEVVTLANASDVGLAAYFYSSNVSRIFRVAEQLQVGMVGVNEALISTEVAPFGGLKDSGLGREGSIYGINEYLDLKYVCLGNV